MYSDLPEATELTVESSRADHCNTLSSIFSFLCDIWAPSPNAYPGGSPRHPAPPQTDNKAGRYNTTQLLHSLSTWQPEIYYSRPHQVTPMPEVPWLPTDFRTGSEPLSAASISALTCHPSPTRHTRLQRHGLHDTLSPVCWPLKAFAFALRTQFSTQLASSHRVASPSHPVNTAPSQDPLLESLLYFSKAFTTI